MPAGRLLAHGAAVVLVTAALAWVFGHLPFGAGAAGILLQAAGAFGIFGEEGVEDLDMVLTLIVSLVLAIALTTAISRRYRP